MTDTILTSTSLSMTSLEIAELTGKRHDHVLRDLRELEVQGAISLPKFGERNTDSRGKERLIYNLPKRETLILTSGYSAVQRAAIIDRWLELEANQKPKSNLEILLASAQELVRLEKKQSRLDEEQKLLTARTADAEAALQNHQHRLDGMDGDTQYMTILAYCRSHGLPASVSFANKAGRIASGFCKERRIFVGRVPDERWGDVGSYPVTTLDWLLENHWFPPIR